MSRFAYRKEALEGTEHADGRRPEGDLGEHARSVGPNAWEPLSMLGFTSHEEILCLMDAAVRQLAFLIDADNVSHAFTHAVPLDEVKEIHASFNPISVVRLPSGEGTKLLERGRPL